MISGHDFPDVRLSREAESLLEGGHKISVVAWIRSPERQKDYEIINGVEVVRIKSSIDKSASFLKKIFQFMKGTSEIIKTVRKIDPDVIHCYNLEMMWPGMKLKRILKKPLVFDMGENWPEMMWVTSTRQSLSLRLQVRAAKILEKWACRKADRIIVVVNESKDRLIEKGIGADKIAVVMNTEIPENFSEKNIDKTLENELKKRFASSFVVSYIGWFGPHRGLDTCIRAMPYVIKEIPHAKLLLVGNGNNFDELNKLTNELGLNNYVIFTGKVPHALLPTYVKISDACLIPHLSNPHTNSTIPNKLFQYMLMGKPQIVTDLRPLKRIVEETQCGLIVPAGDHHAMANAIIKLAKDREGREKMGENGKKFALKKYNWNVDEKKLIEVYKTI